MFPHGSSKLNQKNHGDSVFFQDEKDFSLQAPANRQNNRVYFNGPKKDVQSERLYSEGNKFLKKVMVFAVITWKCVS